ncbi:MAG: four helix bundle protein [Clostridium sp.]|nr:four helix bundle protein [Clostridium sp.]
MNQNGELTIIPKYEKYMQYMIEVILKMPRTEKFNIGNEFKIIMYKTLENILYVNKIEIEKRMYYLNLIDSQLSVQRIMLRLMQKNKWMDDKKFKVSMEMLYEIGKILGGLIKQYAKNNKK